MLQNFTSVLPQQPVGVYIGDMYAADIPMLPFLYGSVIPNIGVRPQNPKEFTIRILSKRLIFAVRKLDEQRDGRVLAIAKISNVDAVMHTVLICVEIIMCRRRFNIRKAGHRHNQAGSHYDHAHIGKMRAEEPQDHGQKNKKQKQHKDRRAEAQKRQPVLPDI